MSLSVCPIAVIQAPIERVWGLLANPVTYTDWTDDVIDRVVPEGRAQAGQRVVGHTRWLARTVLINVRGVDSIRRTPDLTTSLPFDISVLNYITVTPLDASSCQVSFG